MSRVTILKWIVLCCCLAMTATVINTAHKQFYRDKIAKLRSFSKKQLEEDTQTTIKESLPKSMINSRSVVSNQQAMFHPSVSVNSITKDAIVKMVRLRPKIKYLISVNSTGLQCEINECILSSKNVNWRIFNFVKSMAAHSNRRNHIRKTWGSLKYIAGGQFSTIFITGKANTDQQNVIDEEAARFNDIIQINLADDYQHVGLKTLAGMQWASEHLTNDDFYSSCDDDMVVNVGGLQEYIDHYIKEKEKKKWPEFPIICSYETWEQDSEPMRDKQHANYVSEKHFKWPHWPRFCLGGMYTTSVGVARQLFEISRTQPSLLNTDDVWITGILRNILGLPTTMLIKPQPALANHLGYSYNESPKRMLWINYFIAIKSKPMCKC